MATTVATPLRIGPADHGRTMTLEEFREAEEEEGYRYELARGVLEVSEVPNDPHGVVVCKSLRRGQLATGDEHPGIILRYGGGNEFRFWLPHMISGRNPDLGVVLRGAPKDWRGRRLPALAAEVVSRGSVKRDYEVKREEYLAYGLLEYWIVDPFKLHRHRPDPAWRYLGRSGFPRMSKSLSAWSCPASRRPSPSFGSTSKKTARFSRSRRERLVSVARGATYQRYAPALTQALAAVGASAGSLPRHSITKRFSAANASICAFDWGISMRETSR